jgi:hypothetical protein
MLAAARSAPSSEPIVYRRRRVVLETAAGRVARSSATAAARARARAPTARRYSTWRTWPRPPWTRCARRIGDPASTWADGVISAANETARRAGVAVGQPASTAARAMLAHKRSW